MNSTRAPAVAAGGQTVQVNSTRAPVSPVVGDNTRRGEAATDKKAVSSDER